MPQDTQTRNGGSVRGKSGHPCSEYCLRDLTSNEAEDNEWMDNANESESIFAKLYMASSGMS